MRFVPKRRTTVVQRLGQICAMIWAWTAALVVFWIAGHQHTGVEPFVVFAIVASMVFFFAGLLVGLFLHHRALKQLVDAEKTLDRDEEEALRKASSALDIGLQHAGQRIRAWLVVATCAEESGALEEVDEALRRALEHGRGTSIDRPTLVRLHLRIAFAKAARGDLDAATRHLGMFGTIDVSDQSLAAHFARAQALIFYKRGMFRETIDTTSRARAMALSFRVRDRRLLDALEQSALLRLQSEDGGTLRVAEAPPIHDDWIDAVVPELARRQRR